MNYLSQFNREDTEVIFQKIEEIKAYSKTNLEFLLEEISDSGEFSHRLLLKMKVDDRVFQVDSSADSLVDAMNLAKEEMIKLLLEKAEISNKKNKKADNHLFN